MNDLDFFKMEEFSFNKALEEFLTNGQNPINEGNYAKAYIKMRLKFLEFGKYQRFIWDSKDDNITKMLSSIVQRINDIKEEVQEKWVKEQLIRIEQLNAIHELLAFEQEYSDVFFSIGTKYSNNKTYHFFPDVSHYTRWEPGYESIKIVRIGNKIISRDGRISRAIKSRNKQLENVAPINYKKTIDQPEDQYTLEHIISHKNVTGVIEEIKKLCQGKKGKDIAILFIALDELGVIPKNITSKKFHDSCKNSFDWDIGVLRSMTKFKKSYRYSEVYDETEITPDGKEKDRIVSAISAMSATKEN